MSRGSDFLEVEWRDRWAGLDGLDESQAKTKRLTTYVMAKYFLRRGPLQGRAEEYKAWETDLEGKPRRRVSGLAYFAKYQHSRGKILGLKDINVGLGYETGCSRPFRINTYRAEAGTKVFELPISVRRRGYGSDLAKYYKKESSRSVLLQIACF